MLCVLVKIINCIKFCGMHELPLRGHDKSEKNCPATCHADAKGERLNSFHSLLDLGTRWV
jgi:hypothetical protein